MGELASISLRERKYARTKLALLNAALVRIAERPFESISVKELCEDAMVSEATFFNYYPKKTDLLVYFTQLWTIDVSWHARHASKGEGGLSAIEAVFSRTAHRAQPRPRIILEILAFLAKQRQELVFDDRPVTMAERLMQFPKLDNLEDLPVDGVDSLFAPNLEIAIRRGDLPADTNVEQSDVALRTIFFGVPLALGVEEAHRMAEMYRSQVSLLWAGLRFCQ